MDRRCGGHILAAGGVVSERWIALPLDKALYANLHADAVVGFQTAIENGFQNELGGHTRFPGLIERVDIVGEHGDNGRLYLHDLNGDLIAASSKGRIYRVDSGYNVEAISGAPVGGGRRVVIAKTDRELLMAAGGPIVRLRGEQSEILSDDAPLATHVGWIDGITIAVEINSGRFFHSAAGEPDSWDPLDTFSAEGSPDNINSLLVTPFRELMLGGNQSIEQFERSVTGDAPFFRRWAVGDGVQFPYCVVFADNAMWAINGLTELARFSGQVSTAHSEAIGRLLESLDDWSEAWIGGYPNKPLHIVGQKFLIIQAPNATNPYGTKGLTLGYDYRAKKFFSLYGWDAENGVPNRWPGWSHWSLWNKVLVGGEGKIYELSPDSYRHGSDTQRWLVRTAHMAAGSGIQVKNFRLQIRRGLAASSAATAPTIRVRCSRNSRPFGPWVARSLGKAGDALQMLQFGGFGNGSTFQWEISTADDCAVDLVKAEIKAEPLGH